MISQEVVVHRPIMEVFRCLEDVESYRHWAMFFIDAKLAEDTEAESADERQAGGEHRVRKVKALRLGAKINAQIFAGVAYPLPTVIEVTSYVEGRRIGFKTSFPVQSAIYELSPVPGGTRVVATHTSWLWSTFTPVTELWRPLWADWVAQSLSNLKRQVEASRELDAEKQVFFCYKNDEDPFAIGRIWDVLVAEFGRDAVFFDWESIRGGDHWKRVLARELEKCGVLVTVVGPKWLASIKNEDDYVRAELRSALEHGITVVPIVLERPLSDTRETTEHDATRPAKRRRAAGGEDARGLLRARDLPPDLEPLTQAQALRIRPRETFAADAERMLRAVWTAIRAARAKSGRTPA